VNLLIIEPVVIYSWLRHLGTNAEKNQWENPLGFIE